MLSKSFLNTRIGLVQLRAFASVTEYDVAIIGGGPGGYVAAIKAGQKGLKTVCIEKRGTLGGTCLNVGCIPSKALLNSTHKLHDAQNHFKEIGIETGPVTMDFEKLMKSKDNAVTGLTSSIEFLLKKYKVDYVKGWGKFSDANTIAVDLNDGQTTEIKAKHTIIATGSEPTTLPAGMLDVDEKYVVTSTGALALDKIPKRMIVVGGGVIGLEMGSVYQRLGTEVTVVNNGEMICPFLDEEVSKNFLRILKKQGIKFELGAKLISGTNNKEAGVSVVVETKKGNKTIEGDVCLLSIGRKPYTGGLDLEKAGLTANQRGQIDTNKTW